MTVAVDSDRGERAAAAVRHHYDVGNEFYRLWLDRSLTYSCAMRGDDADTLETAQQRKLEYHLQAIGAGPGQRVLDIGCGWGSILRVLSETHGVERAVGLTLSETQAAHIRSRRHPAVEVRTEDWARYEPETGFDGIISIGAFEHFAAPDDEPSERLRRYREFFVRCRTWLNPGGVLSLQTIAYANMSRADASRFMQQEIFPEADLPTLTEIATAAEGVLELRSLRNDRLDYAWTCEQWAARLRAHRDAAVDLVGPDTVARYLHYLKLSALGFRMGKIGLFRMVLRPYPEGYFRPDGTRIP